MFLAARADFATSFLQALMDSPAYHECLQEDGMEPITEDAQKAFCRADFSPGDTVGTLIAEYCQGFPETLFPSLLDESTVVFTDDRLYSGVHVAIDLGITESEATEPKDVGDG